MNDALIVSKLTKKFEHIVFKDISFRVGSQEIVIIMGRNGSGKTTLLKIIARLLYADSGKVTFAPNQTLQGVGFLFQDFVNSLFPWMTVGDNITFPLRIAHIKRRNHHLYNLLSRLQIKLPLNKYPYELSIGQQHLVAFLRMILYNPQIYLLDEPFSGLDISMKKEMMLEFLRMWNLNKRPTIIVTHDIDEALTLGNRILVLGKLPAYIVKEFTIYKSLSQERMLNLRSSLLATLEGGR